MKPAALPDSTPVALPTVRFLTGVLLVLCAGICWSIIPIGIRQFEVADTWHILFYRSIGVLPTIFLLLAYQTKENPVKLILNTGVVGIIGGLGLVVAYAGGVASVRLTTIANAAFLFATAPFLAAIIGRIVLKESIRISTLVAMVIAILGILLMVYDSFSHGNWLGDFLALCSAIGFAIFTVALRAKKSSNTMPVVFVGALLAVVFSAVAITIEGSGFRLPVREIILALGIGCCVLGVGMALYAIGSRVVPAAELALLCMTEVVLAPVWAIIFLGEVPAISVMIGGGILVFAIVFNALTGIRRKPVPVTF